MKPKLFSTYSYFIVFAFFFPVFFNYLGSAGSILINGSLILALFFVIIIPGWFFRSEYHKKVFYFFFFLFFFFLMHIICSIIIGLIFGGVELIQRDFYELHRPVYYFLVFLYAYLFFSKVNEVEKLDAIFLIVFIGIVIVGLNQYFGIFDFISLLYTKQGNVDSRRVSAPFVNPYDYAFIMSFFILYFFLKMFYTSLVYILPLLIALIMFILPQSRSVAATFLVGFFVVFPLVFLFLDFDFIRFKLSKRLFAFYLSIIVLLFVFLASIPYLLENFSYLTGQFVRLVEGEGVGRSAGIRLSQFLFALDKANENLLILLFGNGPSKNEMEYVESIYNYQFYRYGLIGLFLYFVLIVISGSYFSWKILKKIGRNHPSYPLFLALLVWFLIIPLMSIGNNFTEQIRLSFFFYSMLGLLASNYALSVSKTKRVSL